MIRTIKNGKQDGLVVQGWIQTISSTIAMLLGLFLLMQGLSNRLSILETKMQVALEGQGTYITRAEVTLMKASAEAEDQRLQTQIDDLKQHRR